MKPDFSMAPYMLRIREEVKGLKLHLPLLGRLRLPDVFGRMLSTEVVIQGPSLVLFRVKSPFGELRALMSLLPLEPFRQRMQMTAWASRGYPWLLARALTYLIMRTAEQDRQVWEHKLVSE